MSFQNPLPPGIRQVVPDYTSDGVTLTWGFPFRLWAATDLYVGVSANGGATWTQLTLGTNYTITINGVTSAIVTLTAIVPAGNLIRLQGLRTPSRTTSVVNDGIVQSPPLESELDVVEATMQELRRDINAALAAIVVLTANLAAEVARAEAAEAVLTTALAAETARAEAAENAETARAKGVEAALQGQVSTVAGLVAAETLRASNAEAAETLRAERAEAVLQFVLPLGNPASLPTTLPGGAGVYWNNGGALCLTPGGSPTEFGASGNDNGVVTVSPGVAIPTSLPALPGIVWSNGGVICIS